MWYDGTVRIIEERPAFALRFTFYSRELGAQLPDKTTEKIPTPALSFPGCVQLDSLFQYPQSNNNPAGKLANTRLAAIVKGGAEDVP
jgi:hypothetical protein